MPVQGLQKSLKFYNKKKRVKLNWKKTQITGGGVCSYSKVVRIPVSFFRLFSKCFKRYINFLLSTKPPNSQPHSNYSI